MGKYFGIKECEICSSCRAEYITEQVILEIEHSKVLFEAIIAKGKLTEEDARKLAEKINWRMFNKSRRKLNNLDVGEMAAAIKTQDKLRKKIGPWAGAEEIRKRRRKRG